MYTQNQRLILSVISRTRWYVTEISRSINNPTGTCTILAKRPLWHLTKWKLVTNYFEVGSHYLICQAVLPPKQCWNTRSIKVKSTSTLGGSSKSLRLMLWRLPWLKKSGESMSQWSAKIQRCQKHKPGSFKSLLLVSHSQMALLKEQLLLFTLLGQTLFLSESKCHKHCAATTIWWMKCMISETNISKNIKWRTQIYQYSK